MLSTIAVPSFSIRSASHGGTRPPCRGRSAYPERFIRRYARGSESSEMSVSNFRLDLLAPFAYFLTFSCCGSHLHASEKRSVDSYCNQVGSPARPGNIERERYCGARMKEPSFLMD